MNLAAIKRGVRGWLGERPRLLQLIFRLFGKPYTEIAIFRSIIRPGDAVFDLGANTGQYTSLFCRLADKAGAVHAFEPIPPTFAVLKSNLAHYLRKYKLFLNEAAAGESEGVVKMFVSKGRFTEASMVDHAHDAHTGGKTYECRVTTVDRYVSKNRIGNVALIKCDVEGAELPAMKGALGVLTGSNPPMLFLEAWSDWTKDFGYQPADLFRFLEEKAGYVTYHVGRGKIEKVSARQEFSRDLFPDFLNFLCVIPLVHGDRIRSLRDAGVGMIEK